MISGQDIILCCFLYMTRVSSKSNKQQTQFIDLFRELNDNQYIGTSQTSYDEIGSSTKIFVYTDNRALFLQHLALETD